MTTPFRIPLGARIILLVFIAVQAMMMLDLFGTRGAPMVQLLAGLLGLGALAWIAVAWMRHRRG